MVLKGGTATSSARHSLGRLLQHLLSLVRSKNTKEEGKNKRNQKIQAIQRAEQFATENGIDYQPLCLYKEKHKLFKIKHYLDKKEYYFLGMKLFSKKSKFKIESLDLRENK